MAVVFLFLNILLDVYEFQFLDFQVMLSWRMSNLSQVRYIFFPSELQ